MKHNFNQKIKYIIIGHSGYIGRTLLEQTATDGDYILGISRRKIYRENSNILDNLIEIEADIFNDDIKLDFKLNSRPVVYLLAHNSLINFFYKRKSLQYTFEKSSSLYENLINNIKYLNPKKLIFVSTSGSLYPNSIFTNPSTEKDLINPISDYGLSKFIIENYLTNFSESYNINLIICRVSTVYGPSNSKEFGLINYLIKCSEENLTPILYGKETFRDYIHISDLVNILIKIANYQLMHKTYNISYGKSYSCLGIYQKVKKFLKVFNMKLKDFEDKGKRLGEHEKIFISSNRLKNEIGWYPKININSGIKELIKFKK